jgi:serine protease
MKKITLLYVAVFACSTILTYAGNRATVIIPGDHFLTSFRMDSRVQEGDYLPNTIIFKVKQQYRQNCKINSIDNILPVQDLLNSVNAKDLKKIYPNHTSPERSVNAVGLKLVDLSLIYSFNFSSSLTLEKVINQFLSLGYFEFVEPKYIPKLDLVPNDPSLGSQYHLKGNVVGSIDTQTAWDTQTGNAAIVIGIVDTGTEPNHPDLVGNYLGGYDVGQNDSDPTWVNAGVTPNHGCAVSGDACAVTNNSVGVSSPGYNCKFKAIKITDAAGALIAGYEGIAWAADNGCKIINCSWGGSGAGTYGQTIIDYATINKNCLVIASAGNSDKEEFLYPSSYNNVYRVASSDQSDRRSGFSTYGLDVDYSAPGTSIYSTLDGVKYGAMSGTSMAGPVSAGVAGLIQSQFNYSNAFQIGERMKQTCDPLANSATNNTTVLYAAGAGKLGKGRIDAAKALSTTSLKSIVINPITITDGNDNVFMPGETLSISGTFINYLDPSSASAAAVLSIVSGAGTITNGNFSIGALNTLGTKAMNTPFIATVQAGAAINSTIKFKISITDGTFSGDQYFEITVNPDYINITINDVHTSITSKGRIGYNLDATKEGLGFEYQIPSANNMLYEMSLMIGASSSKVSDMFRDSTAGDTDFGSTTRAYQVTSATVSNFDVDGKFNDATATSAIPVSVHHSAYAWSTTPYRKFVIIKYVIKNTGASALSNVYAGIISDWDITSAALNKSNYDATNKMGYCYDNSKANGLYAGIKLLTNSAPANNYCIDNIKGGNGGIDISSTRFNAAKKYTVLSTSRNTDGFTSTVGSGGDVMHCVSSGPFSINANDSIVVAWALIGGDDLSDLKNSACHAQAKWDNTGPCLVGVSEVNAENLWVDAFPNPASNTVNFSYNIVDKSSSSLKIINVLGEVVLTYNNLAQGKNTLSIDVSKLNSGSYFYELKVGDARLTKKLTIAK